ncbi:MAG: hypothetical protein IKQ39_02265 [Oscillospiraceae bacterium]|nr:hypothetical protein [Oscillospiraceae bacterium]
MTEALILGSKAQQLGAADVPGTRDSLGIRSRCKGVSGFLEHCETPMTLSITGGWGTGKTTAMKLIRKQLDPEEQCSIWFNTWQFAVLNPNDRLILDLLQMLADYLKKMQDSLQPEARTRAQNSLNIVEKALAGTRFFGNLLGGKGTVGGVMAFLNKMLDMWRDAQRDAKEITGRTAPAPDAAHGGTAVPAVESASPVILASELREHVGQMLRAICECLPDRRLYLFIDDLDRLNPQVALELMEGMKNFLDCPGCVLIMAVDQDIVERGLRSKYGAEFTQDKEKARQFFDKIIQVPYALPTDTYEISDYVRGLLPASLRSAADDFVGILHALDERNPRTIKRGLNLLQLYSCIENETSDQRLVMPVQRNRMLERYAVLALHLKSREDYDALSNALSEGGRVYDKRAVFSRLRALLYPAKDTDVPPQRAARIRAVAEVFFGSSLLTEHAAPRDLSGVDALIAAVREVGEMVPKPNGK